MWPPKCSVLGARRSTSPIQKPFMSGIKFIYFPYPQRRQVRNKSRADMEKCGQVFADHWRDRLVAGSFQRLGLKTRNKQTRHVWAQGGVDRVNRAPIRFDFGFLQVRAGDKNLSKASLLEEWS